MRHSIIIPCLNHFDMTKMCLESFYKHTDITDVELIIVNDGSSDETKDNIAALLDGETVILNHWPTNKGFAPSVNHGIKVARGRNIIICNNDFLFGPNWLTILEEAFKILPNAYMITSTLVTKDDVSPENFYKYCEKVQKTTMNFFSPWLKYGPWMFKKEVFDMLGLFDEKFIWGTYEDIDMLLRMSSRQLLWGSINRSLVYHYVSVTQNGALAERVGQQYHYTNRDYFVEKWGTDKISVDLYQHLYDYHGVDYKDECIRYWGRRENSEQS